MSNADVEHGIPLALPSRAATGDMDDEDEVVADDPILAPIEICTAAHIPQHCEAAFESFSRQPTVYLTEN